MYKWKTLEEQEIIQLKNVADEIVEYRVQDLKTNNGKIDKKHCINGSKHLWFRKWKSKNAVVRYCAKRCGIKITRFYTNPTLRIMAKEQKNFHYKKTI